MWTDSFRMAQSPGLLTDWQIYHHHQELNASDFGLQESLNPSTFYATLHLISSTLLTILCYVLLARKI
jgi:hypothetical protein